MKKTVMFLAYDGDKVGRKLENLLIDNDDLKIESFANRVWNALRKLEQMLVERHCKIIFASGDSILAKANKEFDVNEVNRVFGEITFSLGIGNTPLEAMLALKKAKSMGFAECCTYSLERGKP